MMAVEDDKSQENTLQQHQNQNEGNVHLALLYALILFSLFVYESLGSDGSQDLAAADRHDFVLKDIHGNNSTENNKASGDDYRTIRIMCIGDSLTRGTILIGNNRDFYPYTSYLETALKNRRRKKDAISRDEESSIPSIEIITEGHRGWTSYDLLHNSINVDTMLKEQYGNQLNSGGNDNDNNNTSSFLDMVIIMAGSNDIFKGKDEVYNVSESVISMHRTVLRHEWDNGILPITIALGIPGSRRFLTNPTMEKEARALSESLQTYAKSESRSTYVPFPFPYKDSDEKWSEDGVHCTETGYKVLGETLAPVVEQTLQTAELW